MGGIGITKKNKKLKKQNKMNKNKVLKQQQKKHALLLELLKSKNIK